MRLRKHKPIRPGVRQENEISKMPARACDIAVSEMTGVPLDQMCGWILVTIDHVVEGKHRSLVLQGCEGYFNDEWAAMWLDRVATDIRSTP